MTSLELPASKRPPAKTGMLTSLIYIGKSGSNLEVNRSHVWHKNYRKKMQIQIYQLENILTVPQTIHRMALSMQTYLGVTIISQKLTGLLLSINFGQWFLNVLA